MQTILAGSNPNVGWILLNQPSIPTWSVRELVPKMTHQAYRSSSGLMK